MDNAKPVSRNEMIASLSEHQLSFLKAMKEQKFTIIEVKNVTMGTVYRNDRKS